MAGMDRTAPRELSREDFINWGRKGGLARKANLTDEELSAIGRKAARAKKRQKAAQRANGDR